MNTNLLTNPLILLAVLVFVLGVELFVRNIGADRLMVYFVALSCIVMAGVGVVMLRRNNQILKRNAELELALADAMIASDPYKLKYAAGEVANASSI